MCIRFILAATAFGALALPLSAQTAADTAFCAVAPVDRICPDFPHDVPEFSEFFEYMVISGAAQAPFDRHAWQAFVSLNWDAIGNGSAGWRGYRRADAVLGQDTARAQCGAAVDRAEVVISDLVQSDGNALVDQAGNYIVYETRLNPMAEGYVLDHQLDRLSGQQAMAGPVDFPRGVDGDAPASVMIKTAWTVLDSIGDDAGFITARGLIAVPAAASLSGQPMCIERRLGLVGMHIVTKVASGNGDQWVWATFEHRRNAPVAPQARDINAIYGAELFPEGCGTPADGAGMILASAGAGVANLPPEGPTLWAAGPPYAVGPVGAPIAPTQVARCWDIFAPTQATNALWQDRLRGSVLAQYMLISAQWQGANPSPYIENGELPRFLSNTTMETYLQTDRAGTCMGCHAEAVTATGAPSDFTFLLRSTAP